jgi:RimJ/RimL family protein N-acetyltransferase
MVTLRPIERDDLALLDRWRNDREHEGEYGDFLAMHRGRTGYDERWAVDGLLSEQEGQLLICLDGEPVGVLQWHPVPYGPNRGSTALNLGVSITPSARGRGVGSRAQRLLAEYLFEQTLANRVEASTDVTNIAEQRALERAGFHREGVLRGAQFRRGEWHDMVVYSRLRTDT